MSMTKLKMVCPELKIRPVSLVLLLVIALPACADGLVQPPADLPALMRQATQAMRTRQYAQALALLQAVMAHEPEYGAGRAAAMLARAGLLSYRSQEALSVLLPLREHWEHDEQAAHQVALCQYAVAEWQGDAGLPETIAAAFGRPEAEYPCDHPDIQQAAARIFASCHTDRDRARAAYNFVRLRTRYDKSLIPLGRQSVLDALATGRAVCTGFAQLCITLCRAGGVPARLVSGEGRSGFHNWAEVWLQGEGWVPVDPTRGRKKDAFGRLDGDIVPYPEQRSNW